jgi:hypothetical protein
MRREIGLLLAGVGVFFLVIAVALPVYIVGQVVKFPLNEFQSAVLTGSNVQYFSAQNLTEETGVTVRATYTIKGDASQGTGSTAVWDQVSYSYDVTNGAVQSITTRRAAFDRKTAQLVNCCGSNVAGNKNVRQSGIVGWVFPFNTQKQTYQVFDTTLDKPEPFVFSGTDTTAGVPTYRYVENVPATQFTSITVPGYFVGSSSPSISAPEYYQTHVIYWVDPQTGALLNVNEFEELSLRNPDTGQAGLVLFRGTLAMTPASLQHVVSLDNSGRNELSLLRVILPLAFGIAGAVLLIAGILLGRGRSGVVAPGGLAAVAPAPGTATATEPVPASGSAESIIPGMETRSTERPAASPAGDAPDAATGETPT